MSNLEPYKIDLQQLKEGITDLCFTLDDTFFTEVETSEVLRGQVDAALSIRKTENYYRLKAHLEGIIVIPCDRCLDDMELPIATDAETSIDIDAKEMYLEQSIQIDEENVIDIAWWLYENVALVIPIQHVHETGKCNVAMIKALEEHSTTRSSDGNKMETDPRWNKLKTLMSKEKI